MEQVHALLREHGLWRHRAWLEDLLDTPSANPLLLLRDIGHEDWEELRRAARQWRHAAIQHQVVFCP
jgi:hypothetical protein